MKDVDAYLPPELVRYQRKPNVLWKIWLVVAALILGVFWANTIVYPPVSGSLVEPNDQPPTETEAPSPPTIKVEIASTDEPGIYKIFENEAQVGRLKLASKGGVKTAKFYDMQGPILLKTKLKPNEAVNVYDAGGTRIVKVKYKKGGYQVREMGSSNSLRSDMNGRISNLEEAMFFFFPISVEAREKLAGMRSQLVFPEDAEEPDDTED